MAAGSHLFFGLQTVYGYGERTARSISMDYTDAMAAVAHYHYGLHRGCGCGRTIYRGCRCFMAFRTIYVGYRHFMAAVAHLFWVAVNFWLFARYMGVAVVDWLRSHFSTGLQWDDGCSHIACGLHAIYGSVRT